MSEGHQEQSQRPQKESTLSQFFPVRRGEFEAVVLSVLYHFLVQGGWNVLKPIRDEMAVAGDTRNIPWLYTATMVGTLIATPIFAFLAARTPRRLFIPITYIFIGGSMTALFVAFSATEGETNAWISRVFFVWASVFNLFLFSLFWAFMADIWSSEQSKRLFGLVGIGGTAGVIGGSFLVGRFATDLGLTTLVTVFAVMIALSIVAFLRLASIAQPGAEQPTAEHPGDSNGDVHGEPSRDTWAGFKAIAQSPYLLGIAFSVICHTVIGTFLWIMRTELAAEHFGDDRDARVAFFANITLYANLITIAIQLVLFRVISKRIGIALMLGLVPLVAFVGFGLIEILPAMGFSALWVVFWVQTLRRGLHYAVSKPAREMLFTVVTPDERYKSKSVIDTFFYRGGDLAGSWAEKAVSAIAMSAGVIAIPLAGAWFVVSLLLGRKQKQMAAEQQPR